MNTKLITQTCSSVNRKHTVPPPEGKVCTATKVQRRTNIPRRTNRQKGITQAVRRWFVRSINKGGQRLLSTACTDKASDPRSVILQLGSPDEDHRRAKFKRGSEKPNLMDAVNGNATENLYCIARCCSGIANIHEETF